MNNFRVEIIETELDWVVIINNRNASIDVRNFPTLIDALDFLRRQELEAA